MQRVALLTSARSAKPELDVGRVHPWVELGRVGSGHKILRLGRVGLGQVQCQKCQICNLYARNSSTIIPYDKKL